MRQNGYSAASVQFTKRRHFNAQYSADFESILQINGNTNAFSQGAISQAILMGRGEFGNRKQRPVRAALCLSLVLP